MSETPRTDEREFAAIDLKPSARVVYASFARQLETELAEARAEIERKDALIEQMRRSLEWALSFPACTCYDHDTSQDQQTCSCGHADRVQRAMAALAAEGGE